ncbi:unnamed protein product [Acanthoscelides obtectus]|uniref:Uncharacterized protein n=1 Tax=Acanthoscelides obtectus TaxID=200917 RepID=A0A9P0L4M0_ACAOB|nr:unnamed protein product [Acanthoscelides obtectus]CAK1621568.1 hypothetical protein AOBTE_LOCUS1016 [Acanthoscelides obtectus]
MPHKIASIRNFEGIFSSVPASTRVLNRPRQPRRGGPTLRQHLHRRLSRPGSKH